ncbi:MAG: hypothetical protein K8W52_44345, partial [Deltaproteobacteria bacterium]|nr:hypothetical protein [Deltaproteobacteria bacterium]
MSDNDKSGLFGDEDIFAELDAWDRTFDALHETDAATAEAAAEGGKPASDAPAAAIEAAAIEAAPIAIEAAAIAPAAIEAAPIEVAPAESEPEFEIEAALESSAESAPVPVIEVRAAAPRRNDAPTTPPPVHEPVARVKPRTIPPPPPPRAAPESPFGDGGDERDETDFSDLGVAGEPEALGTLLGTPPPLAPPPEEAELRAPVPVPRTTGPIRPFGAEDAPTKILPLKPLRPAHTLPRASAPADAEDDDAVLTSAARPAIRLESGPTDDELFGDLPAQPIPVVAALRPGAEATRVADLAALSAAFDDGGSFAGDTGTGQGRRAANAGATRVVDPSMAALAEARRPDAPEVRGPAIVRRHDLEQRRRRQEFEEESSGGGDFSSGDATRVADIGQIEAMALRQREESAAASAAAAAFFAERPGGEVELRADDDFYDDIEIGGSSDDAAEAGHTPSSSGRRAGPHVVRRTAAPATSGPIVAASDDDDDEMSIAISHDDEAPAAAPVEVSGTVREIGEDDFSDLAGDQVTPVPPPVAHAPSAPVARPSAPAIPPIQRNLVTPVVPGTPVAMRPMPPPVSLSDDDDEDDDSADWWDDDAEGGPPPAARTGTLPVPPPSAGGRPSTIPPPIAAAAAPTAAAPAQVGRSADEALDALSDLDVPEPAVSVPVDAIADAPIAAETVAAP